MHMGPPSGVRLVRTLRLAIVAVCAVAGLGCAAPGSRLARIAISGTVIERDAPIPISMEVALTPDYGFSRLDWMLSESKDRQQATPPVIVEIVDGQFSHQFPPFAYHGTFFMLPPIGFYPRHPPPPTFTVSFSDASSEAYVIGFDRGTFRYEAYNRVSRSPIARDRTSWVIANGEYVRLGTADTPVWHLRLHVSRR
jgi:hypothetical protein